MPPGSHAARFCVEESPEPAPSGALADRARLLDRLVASLDMDANVEAAWDAVADQREQELDVGAVPGVPLELAIGRLEARCPG